MDDNQSEGSANASLGGSSDTLLVGSSDTLPGGSSNGTGDTLQRRLQEEYYQELDAQLPEIPHYTKDGVGGNWLVHDIIKHKDVKRNKKNIRQYLVQWRAGGTSWKNANDLMRCRYLVNRYNRRNHLPLLPHNEYSRIGSASSTDSYAFDMELLKVNSGDGIFTNTFISLTKQYIDNKLYDPIEAFFTW
jgi:hypothetical protein